MGEVYVDRFKIFCAWYDWWKSNDGFHYYGWGAGDEILEGLKTNPQKIISKGRIEGWWKK
jgi:hypothetical protein